VVRERESASAAEAQAWWRARVASTYEVGWGAWRARIARVGAEHVEHVAKVEADRAYVKLRGGGGGGGGVTR